MKILTRKYFTEIIPEDEMKILNKEKTEKYDYSLCLGCNDSVDNYIELTIEEANKIIPDERGE